MAMLDLRREDLSSDGLLLPHRESKPRTRGLTMMIDNGLPTALFADVLASTSRYVDLVKFGWGTALVTHDLPRKLRLLADQGIDFLFGGTLFEKYVAQARFGAFRQLCRRHGCRYVEVSNGTIELDDRAKAGFIGELAAEFTVLAEVGLKDSGRSARMEPADWVSSIRSDLQAGARLVILEARESGSSGICNADGSVRERLLDHIVASGIQLDRLLFEAPTRTLQVYLVKRFGTGVNLGNIAASDLISLETLRLGLRADTLFVVDQDARP